MKNKNIDNFIIYALCDPRTNQIRYIGRSSSGLKRPAQHWEANYIKRAPNTHTTRWILKLMPMLPEIIVIESFESYHDLNDAEEFWIAYFKSIGAMLTNHNRGGKGQNGYFHSEETKRKIGKANEANPGFWKGKKIPAESVAKMSATKKKRFALCPQQRPTQDVIDKIRDSQPHATKLVDQYGTIYPSQCAAARHFGVEQGYIQSCLRSSGRSVKGYFLKKVSK